MLYKIFEEFSSFLIIKYYEFFSYYFEPDLNLTSFKLFEFEYINRGKVNYHYYMIIYF